jgi:hypothetical protein
MRWKLTRRAWICVTGLLVLAVACDAGGLLVVESTGAGGAGAASPMPIVLSNGAPSSATGCNNNDGGAPYTCAEAVAPGGVPAKLCGGSKEAMFYDGLVSCGCVSACKDACALDACAGLGAGVACLACLSNFAHGCGAELAACFGGDAGPGQ